MQTHNIGLYKANQYTGTDKTVIVNCHR